MGIPFYLTIILSVIAACLYLYIKWILTYWSRKGVDTHKSPSHYARIALDGAYKQFRSKNLKHGGIYLALRPFFLPLDLDLIRDIMQKNFDHFVNHGMYSNEKDDPLTGNLVRLEDEKWRSMRTKLTPTFTSGKMKMMFQTMAECRLSLIEVLRQNASMGEPAHIRDVLGRFTMDIIGSVAFGINCNTLHDQGNDFRKFGKTVGIMTWRKRLSFLLPRQLLTMVGFRAHKKYEIDFILSLVEKMVNDRESNNVYRKDFMHLMLQLKNRGKTVDDQKIMDDNKKGNFLKMTEVAAQCFVFFVAGFETSSSLMTFALLEIAQRPEIQEKLRQEMNGVLKKHGAMTYEAIMEMQYLDQVVHESLRKHPPAFTTVRVCNKDFTVPGTDLVIEKGTNLFVPIINIHNDPEYYPEPEKFDPERFTPQNRNKRHPLAFLPFGEGPRMCIGARFGLLQSKVGLTAVITNFKVTLNKKTKLPIEYDDRAMILSAKGDIWLNFESVKD